MTAPVSKRVRYVLGVQDAHNSSVCLIKDGQPIYAIQEERLTYHKNAWTFPYKSIDAALAFARIEPEDVDRVALASQHGPVCHDGKSVVEQYDDEASTRGRLINMAMRTPLYDFYKLRRKKERIKEALAVGFHQDRIDFVEHHQCHAAAVYYGLAIPREQQVLILTLDGSGDGLCATVNIGHKGIISRIASTDKGHSLGNIYSRVTYHLGFKPWEHEYKLMGMAAYASANGREQLKDIFHEYLDLDEFNPLCFKRQTTLPTTMVYDRLNQDLKSKRFDWVCGGLQDFTEDLMVRWVTACIKRTGIHHVACSGGVFMNVKANKALLDIPELESLYVMPSCGDETNSFGAAYHCWHEQYREQWHPQPFTSMHLGDDINDNEVQLVLRDYQKRGHKFEFERKTNIDQDVAQLLAQNKIVARCRGRMEFGARALGNRSILADPSNLKAVREINMMVKKRDFWMPFAPITTRDAAARYIVNPKEQYSPHMMLSYATTKEREAFLAAVHQADHSARCQVIDEADNPEVYDLIKTFEALTGRAVLLNTSYNLHGFPIVRGPREAMSVFCQSGLKYLALGEYLVWKPQVEAQSLAQAEAATVGACQI